MLAEVRGVPSAGTPTTAGLYAGDEAGEVAEDDVVGGTFHGSASGCDRERR